MQASVFIGVDVAKREIAYAVHGQARSGSVANDAASLQAWLQHWPAGSCLAMESTGRYHQVLAYLAHQAGWRVFVLNPREVKRYRQSLGVRGKTDHLDAQVIAQMLAERQGYWQVWRRGSDAQQRLDAMLRRRATLTVHRGAIEQALGDVAELAQPLRDSLRALDALLEALDAQIAQCVRSDEQLSQAYDRLDTITGIGPQTAALLANLLVRIPFGNAQALVAYSGLDPRPNDSGQHRGKRRLTKRGPAQLRRLIYLAAKSASRSKALKGLYESIRAKGFSGTQALVILARKLLRVAYAIYKSGEHFDASRLVPTAGSA